MSLVRLRDEGQRLAHALSSYREDRPFILAIPRGGVVLGDVIARALAAPLDVLVVGKLLGPGGTPVGAIAQGGGQTLDARAMTELRLGSGELEKLIDREHERQAGLITRMRGAWPMPDLADRTVILVDDAVVTGLTMRAAADAAERHETRQVVVAAPYCSAEAAEQLTAAGYAVVRLETLSAALAARVHDDERREPCPPLADAEVHELVTRELHDVGYDPFGALATDGI